jgi:hypothetical protein
VTKPKTQVLAVNLPAGDRAIDVAQIIADFVQCPVVVATSDGNELTIAPRARPVADSAMLN